jgi:hypothetical protein
VSVIVSGVSVVVFGPPLGELPCFENSRNVEMTRLRKDLTGLSERVLVLYGRGLPSEFAGDRTGELKL